MFDIMRSDNNISVFQVVACQQFAAMQTFEQNRIVVFFEIFYQFFRIAGANDIWKRTKEFCQFSLSLIIIYGVAETLEVIGVFASVFETMQMNFNTTFRERLNSKENVNNAAVIGRIRNIETYDMQMFIRCIAHIF